MMAGAEPVGQLAKKAGASSEGQLRHLKASKDQTNG